MHQFHKELQTGDLRAIVTHYDRFSFSDTESPSLFGETPDTFLYSLFYIIRLLFSNNNKNDLTNQRKLKKTCLNAV